ncbi:class I adenylate-forming enzyme family protein [Nocardioides insulae]|uniref:class I adenylate-forming enzyme family protein n=1 Tax=Nocardioides insulae TaxID=394734 RepID=UPI0004148AC3|nr:AMP-binding protein [Nocardioides insulae]
MSRYLPAGHTSASLDYPRAAVGDVLAGSARRYADRPAIRDGETTLTYAELYDRALRIATGLRELGVRQGDAVALHQPNSMWFTTTYFGILLAGAAVTPVNPSLPPLAIADQLGEVGAVAVFTHPQTVAGLPLDGVPTLAHRIIVPGTSVAPGEVPEDTDCLRVESLLDHKAGPAASPEPDDVAHFSFTGGTTGRSKAVRVLHRNVVANSLQVQSFRGGAVPRVDAEGGVYLEAIDGGGTRYISPLGEGVGAALAPMFHAMGLVAQVGSVVSGSCATVVGRFDPAGFIDLIEQARITTLPGSPALFHALLTVPGVFERDLTSVKVVNSGAAPIDTDTLAKLGRVFPNATIVEGYGLTEATMAVTMHPVDDPNPTPKGSVGTPLFDTEVAIRELGAGAEVPVGETGEVWVRGPQVTAGYHGQPGLTAEQYVDGWLRTGDIGRLDEDGFLFLVGRAKDMLIYKGYNVYPVPLEESLHQHPAVAGASVIGAPVPEVGEIPVAFVVLEKGYDATPELAEELMGFVAERVAAYAKVREVVFVDALPVSAAGKILKTELRQNYSGGAR